LPGLLSILGRWLARFLNRPTRAYGSAPATTPERLLATLRPGDVLLVEGRTRISTAIKYLTQSTWSHAALFVGVELQAAGAPAGHCFIEVDLRKGVRSTGVDEYAALHTRICRPVGLTQDDCKQVAAYAISRIGHQYDLRNVIDLARYLLPTPPVPTRFRRRMIALGSGDPTRAICSTLIALAFQSIRYPILPLVEWQSADTPECRGCRDEILHVRHHSLFAPRDFDVSPYFAVVKPALSPDFDFRLLKWHDGVAPGAR
jgi:hypothetical protein